jgi:tripartite-type tricarboxylate transporter receptor subunit TctC
LPVKLSKLFLLLLGWAALVALPTAHAQGFPNKAVRIIIPFAPGGSTDANARIINDKLSTLWGQPVIVESKPGANTVIGSDFVAKSAPDGYTLLLTSTAHVVNPSLYTKLPYDPVNDLAAVTIVSVSPFALVAANTLPVKSAKDVIALLRAKPGSLSFGTSDSSSLFVGHLFNTMAKTELQSVPYKGAGPLMTDLAGGHVPLGFAAVSSVQTQVRANRVRLLGVGSLTPSPLFPDAPPIANDLPGFEAVSWFGLFAPRGTPKDIISKIHRDLAIVLKDADVQKRFNGLGAEAGSYSTEEFEARIKREMALWANVAKVSGIKPE